MVKGRGVGWGMDRQTEDVGQGKGEKRRRGKKDAMKYLPWPPVFRRYAKARG